MIPIPPQMPAMGGERMRRIGRFLLRLIGWRIVGELPNEPRLLVAAAPHTSNWDFVVVLAAILVLGVRGSIMMKKEVFVWPVAGLWRWFGFIPTDRSAPGGIVEQMVEAFRRSDRLWVGITPEGTRSHNARWKTGFLRIAHEANVPVLLLSWDYPSRTLRFGKLMRASGDHERDLQEIRTYFAAFTGKHPDLHG